MEEIYIVRHGETDANLNKILQGQDDSPLTVKGTRQSVDIGNYLKRIRFDSVYTSDLGRCLSTTMIICGIIEYDLDKIIQDPRLREMNTGILTNKDKNWTKKHYPEFKVEPDFRIESGESPLDLQNRAVEFLHELYNDENTRGLVVTHGGVIRAIMTHIKQENFKESLKKHYPSNYVGKISYDGERSSVTETFI